MGALFGDDLHDQRIGVEDGVGIQSRGPDRTGGSFGDEFLRVHPVDPGVDDDILVHDQLLMLVPFTGSVRQVGNIQLDVIRFELSYTDVTANRMKEFSTARYSSTTSGSTPATRQSNRKTSRARVRNTSFKDPIIMVTSGDYFSTNVLF
jgi:hypothetical protein